MSTADPLATAFLHDIWSGLGGADEALEAVETGGHGDLPSVFAVTDLATASVAAAGLAVAELIAARHGRRPAVRVDRRLASIWFASSIRPMGWSPPPLWDPVAGDYAAADGWIRLHTNAPHHRDAALSVLGVPAERQQVAQAVSRWDAEALEAAVVAQGGCAGAMRTAAEWAAHPQGQAVAAEPLLHAGETDAGDPPRWTIPPSRPLTGIHVLDLTRVLAGPVATRFLAGFGADVLRIDPPGWNEPGVEPDVTLGKRCARLDLRTTEGRAALARLLAGADVLVHGYRSDALERLGLGSAWRRRTRPGLVEVALDAYGWTGPWKARRGFDSIVQMSAGIAEAGMRRLGRDRPTPLPVQALDHATGYILAAATLRGLTRRLAGNGAGVEGRTSLARVAALLASRAPGPQAELAADSEADLSAVIERTGWGPARRVRPPLSIDGAAVSWTHAAGPLGTAPAAWKTMA